MTIELNPEQTQALDSSAEKPPRVVDPRTNQTYVLVPAEKYDQILGLLGDGFDVRSAYPLMDAVAAKEGWKDPALDVYNQFESRPLP